MSIILNRIPYSISLYQVQILICCPLLLNALFFASPKAFADFIALNPDLLCLVVTAGVDYLGLIPFGMTVSALITARTVRDHSPALYNRLDHDKVTFRLFLFVVLAVAGTMFSQWISCGHVCNMKPISAFYLEAQVLLNVSEKTDLNGEKYTCRIPFSEISLLVVVILFISIMIFKLMKYLHNCRKQKNIYKMKAPDIRGGTEEQLTTY